MVLLASLLMVAVSLSSSAMAAEAPRSIPEQDSAHHARLSPVEIGQRVAERVLARGILPVKTTSDLQLESLLVFYDVTGDEKYLSFVRDNVQQRDPGRLDPLSSIGFSLFERTQDRRYLGSFEHQTREYRKDVLRAFDGAVSFYQDEFAVLRRDDGDIYLERDRAPIFVDHLGEYASRMAKTGRLSGDQEFYREGARQILIFREALRDPRTGLWAHGRGWYESSRHLTATKWGRAHGWLMRSLVETLTYLPPNSAEFEQVSEVLRDVADALVRYQDAQGFWHQVIDHPESYPESSATGLMSYYFARAVHQGYLPKHPFQAASTKAFEALTKNRISASGEIYGGVRDTPPLTSIERYLSRATPVQDPHAVAAVIFSAAGQLVLDGKGRIPPAWPQAH